MTQDQSLREKIVRIIAEYEYRFAEDLDNMAADENYEPKLNGMNLVDQLMALFDQQRKQAIKETEGSVRQLLMKAHKQWVSKNKDEHDRNVVAGFLLHNVKPKLAQLLQPLKGGIKK